MERFKISEKETKAKAFSNVGVRQQPKMVGVAVFHYDPKEKAKSETRDWLNNTGSNDQFSSNSLQEKVDGIRASYSGSLVSLTDICMKPLGEACATQSILQYYKMDPKNLDGFAGVDHDKYCFQHYTSDEDRMSAFKGPLEPSTTLGGFSGNNYS
ncbi:hypothetical protein L1987_53368 [Smallanthus sonchifolius]|uniref:Uncharacterized protein n=1 Tax=Smallanthus sonchifolius TaxID=185202 RepID=A0ACB9EWW1_9ASTR|nr:hypothetical protein L1987_53368 [Smallanthus sonchifolius]